MSDVKHKLMRAVSDVEVELRTRGINLGEFLKSVPVGRSTWSQWKQGHRTANAVTWQKVERAFKEVTSGKVEL